VAPRIITRHITAKSYALAGGKYILFLFSAGCGRKRMGWGFYGTPYRSVGRT
jgi:hypothetical protein